MLNTYIIEAGGQPAFTWRGASALSALAGFLDAVFPGACGVRVVPTGNDDEAHMVARLRQDGRADVLDLYAYPATEPGSVRAEAASRAA